jgi:hypothetical protein
MNPTLLERRNVSRKTPGDGMVEITKPTAEMLLTRGREFDLTTPAGDGSALLTSMPCTCRGAENPHEHWFLRSDLFRSLKPGTDVELILNQTRIEVRSPTR